ncbi:MAG: metal-sulfur cluster assembly factor [Candidatus Woesearchaeota archaeon]
MKTKEEVVEVLSKIIDPEIELDIWTLGLIYDITINDDNTVKVLMTLTSPMCPFGPVIIGQIKVGLEEIGFDDVDVELTFDPVWKPSDDVKMMLGLS